MHLLPRAMTVNQAISSHFCGPCQTPEAGTSQDRESHTLCPPAPWNGPHLQVPLPPPLSRGSSGAPVHLVTTRPWHMLLPMSGMFVSGPPSHTMVSLAGLCSLCMSPYPTPRPGTLIMETTFPLAVYQLGLGGEALDSSSLVSTLPAPHRKHLQHFGLL